MNAVATIGILFVMTIPIIVVGFVFAYILTKPEHIFASYRNFIDKNLPEWLSKPLGACYICFVGQLATWLYPFLIMPLLGLKYSFFAHTYFVSQSILNVLILKYFYSKIDVETTINDEVRKEIKDPPELKEKSAEG